jgi:hypothetical protein
MRKVFLLLLLPCFLNAQKWDWANYGNGPHSDSKGSQVCVDKANNVFVIGSSTDSISFGNYNLAPGYFLVKYDAEGSVITARNIDHGADEMFNDEDGNLIIYGGYHTDMYIGHHYDFTVTARS